ncbi:MAG: arginine--tRNA ligase, partial [Clostridia bacterium]|nr:arginine--tRNA ligase [Clostridia bacterium]
MSSLIEEIRQKIKNSLNQALQEAQSKELLPSFAAPDFMVEIPREKENGDFATNLAMLSAKPAKTAPRKIAEILAAELGELPLAKIEIAGPGFINFYLQPQWILEILPRILAAGSNYGRSNLGQGQKVQVEFVSANPTGLLHMGNARGAALGDSLASVLDFAGYNVSREFYINDAGNQIENFGLSLEARYLELLGQKVEFPEEGYHGQDIITTMQGFIAQFGDQYLQEEPAVRRKIMVDYALKEKLTNIKNSLAKFGVEYDVWFSEKSLHDSGAVMATLQKLEQNGYIYEKEGAKWFKGTELGLEKDEVLVRSNGLPTYYAADIAYHLNKFERGFDRVINIWGADHHGHVARMKSSLQALGLKPEALQVILMQLVRLYQNGELVRMSKRTGQFVTLDELVEEVGKDAARYFFVMRSSDSHLDFDLDLAKSHTNDNPVYYVQYAHARICSIFRQLEAQAPQTAALEE